MKLRDLNAPAVGYSLTLMFTALGAVGWLRGEIAALTKDAEKRDQNAARVIAARDREADDLKARIASLEQTVRNCRP